MGSAASRDRFDRREELPVISLRKDDVSMDERPSCVSIDMVRLIKVARRKKVEVTSQGNES